ncbi:hypothetical protein FJR38_13065 [Anabaena sp. UHCC 0253]|uniref:hypothetical protein n=1 Tax=Anabaena sp. UHCC 0253 TaxID=2590019 RepID=UPI001447E4F4|nr:hypothetical protein [Anabaena sp. UHCC 0253]MTJ53504.1 hypothetical protein [Anabaena sp. UHCC 0253]
MLFEFVPEIEAGIKSGIYEVVSKSSGELLGIARNKATGKIVAHAVGVIIDQSASINPLTVPVDVIMGGLQMLQTHRGFQKTYKMLDTLQNSVGVLQTTTSLIGVGVVGGTVLSAVNLYQTLKLRKQVELLHLEVKNGFLDLKETLKYEGEEVRKRIDEVAVDIKFHAHQLILMQAYGQFQQALQSLKTAFLIEDSNIRNNTLGWVINTLNNSLSSYKNPAILSDTCAAGYLRRMECAWAIEQTIALTYQLQHQYDAVYHQLDFLQNQIRKDCLTVIDKCESEAELDFIFPEISCILNNDLAVLSSWQDHVDWIKNLPASERKLLASSDLGNSDSLETKTDSEIVQEPKELVFYQELKNKSHYLSLRDQLRFIIEPKLRKEYESYITEQATNSGYNGLVAGNWQEIADLTLANLYWYFQDKSKTVGA